MGRIVVNNICGVGIVYRRSNPREVFVEVKDDGYPQKVMRRKLNFIGGNWIGPQAKNDTNPRWTFGRELQEELSFDRPLRTNVELQLLGQADEGTFNPTPEPKAPPSRDNYLELDFIKVVIEATARPFADYVNTVPKSVLDSADPQNKRDGYSALASYYTCGLDDTTWCTLFNLQQTFGNLSNESITLITTLDKIIENGTMTAFGHDGAFQAFFLQHGFPEAQKLPLLHGVENVWAGMPLSSYEEYEKRYEVLKKP